MQTNENSYYDGVYVIIPAYNAAGTIADVISEIKQKYAWAKIIVVDDGSTDETENIVKSFAIKLINNTKNEGVGSALKRGIRYALEQGAEYFVTIGADGQRDVEDIPELIEKLKHDKCSLVVGSKMLLAGQKMPLARKLGVRLFTFIVNRLFKASFTDVLSGFRAFDRNAANLAGDLSDSYAFDVDFYIKIIKQGFAYKEIPVKVYYEGNESKMNNIFFVGLSILFLIIRRRLTPNYCYG